MSTTTAKILFNEMKIQDAEKAQKTLALGKKQEREKLDKGYRYKRFGKTYILLDNTKDNEQLLKNYLL